jgi:hypothetical protein
VISSYDENGVVKMVPSQRDLLNKKRPPSQAASFHGTKSVNKISKITPNIMPKFRSEVIRRVRKLE